MPARVVPVAAQAMPPMRDAVYVGRPVNRMVMVFVGTRLCAG